MCKVAIMARLYRLPLLKVLTNEGVIQLLLERGANVNAQGSHYGSAPQAAHAEGNTKVVDLLVQHGAHDVGVSLSQ